MKELAVALIASVSLAGCAQMSAADSSPETQCRYFARNEGLAVVHVNGVDVAGSGHNVRLRWPMGWVANSTPHATPPPGRIGHSHCPRTYFGAIGKCASNSSEFLGTETMACS